MQETAYGRGVMEHTRILKITNRADWNAQMTAYAAEGRCWLSGKALDDRSSARLKQYLSKVGASHPLYLFELPDRRLRWSANHSNETRWKAQQAPHVTCTPTTTKYRDSPKLEPSTDRPVTDVYAMASLILAHPVLCPTSADVAPTSADVTPQQQQQSSVGRDNK